MPSEPIEAVLVYPPVLNDEQEEQYRQLDRDGPLILAVEDSPTSTAVNTPLGGLSRSISRHSDHATRHPPTSPQLQRVSTRASAKGFAVSEKALKEKEQAGLERQVTVSELKEIHRKEGFKIVEFDKGTGEDPREWSNGKKWYVLVNRY